VPLSVSRGAGEAVGCKSYSMDSLLLKNYSTGQKNYSIRSLHNLSPMIIDILQGQCFSTWVPRIPCCVPWKCYKLYYMERLGSAKWLEIFERFRDLKKVEKHCTMMSILIWLWFCAFFSWFFFPGDLKHRCLRHKLEKILRLSLYQTSFSNS